MSFHERASQAIRDSGGRMTSQRELIIDILDSAHQHLDAEALYRLAHQQDENISLATVYRTLNMLEEAGLVQQRYISRDHERKYYEPVHVEEEYHFTCRRCRKVIAFQSELVDEIKRRLEAELNIQVINACVCFDGLCPDCRQEVE